jgi:hypothetical protein
MLEVKAPDFSDSSSVQTQRELRRRNVFLDFTELPMEIYEGLLLCSFESVEYRESSLLRTSVMNNVFDGC